MNSFKPKPLSPQDLVKSNPQRWFTGYTHPSVLIVSSEMQERDLQTAIARATQAHFQLVIRKGQMDYRVAYIIFKESYGPSRLKQNYPSFYRDFMFNINNVSKELFIRNLQPSANKDLVQKALMTFGSVEDVDVQKKKVTFSNEQGALNALMFASFDKKCGLYAQPFMDLSIWKPKTKMDYQGSSPIIFQLPFNNIPNQRGVVSDSDSDTSSEYSHAYTIMENIFGEERKAPVQRPQTSQQIEEENQKLREELELKKKELLKQQLQQKNIKNEPARFYDEDFVPEKFARNKFLRSNQQQEADSQPAQEYKPRIGFTNSKIRNNQTKNNWM